MCPDFDPTVKYDKASSPEEHREFTPLPNDYGQPFYHEMSEPIIVKLKDSRKFLQLKFSVLTKHDFMAQKGWLNMRGLYEQRSMKFNKIQKTTKMLRGFEAVYQETLSSWPTNR